MNDKNIWHRQEYETATDNYREHELNLTLDTSIANQSNNYTNCPSSSETAPSKVPKCSIIPFLPTFSINYKKNNHSTYVQLYLLAACAV